MLFSLVFLRLLARVLEHCQQVGRGVKKLRCVFTSEEGNHFREIQNKKCCRSALFRQAVKQITLASIMASDAQKHVVTLRYEDLVNGVDLTDKIEEAYGYHGLGLLTVSGVPNFPQLRKRLLPLARQFAKFSEEVKQAYEHKESFYAFGWSHGKELLQGNVPDVSKGSFYNNPQHNDPFADSPELIERWPSFCHKNIWPTELPELEEAFMECGSLICDVGALIARQCDLYVLKKHQQYEESRLHRMLTESRCTKARLLHYFPVAENSTVADVPTGAGAGAGAASSTSTLPSPTLMGTDGTGMGASDCMGMGAGDADAINTRKSMSRTGSLVDEDFGSWCGWHNDHGSLTGLCPGMLIEDISGSELTPAFVESLSETERRKLARAGLYIQTRGGDIIHVVVPKDHMAFQIGEAAQIHSAGVLQATPHAVRGPGIPGVCRESFAVFMEPEFSEAMSGPRGANQNDVQSHAAVVNLPAGVPPLSTRYGTRECPYTTCNFGDFSQITYGAYLAPEPAATSNAVDACDPGCKTIETAEALAP